MSPLLCMFSLNSRNIMVACTTGTGFPCVIVIPIQLQTSHLFAWYSPETSFLFLMETLDFFSNFSNTLRYFRKVFCGFFLCTRGKCFWGKLEKVFGWFGELTRKNGEIYTFLLNKEHRFYNTAIWTVSRKIQEVHKSKLLCTGLISIKIKHQQ